MCWARYSAHACRETDPPQPRHPLIGHVSATGQRHVRRADGSLVGGLSGEASTWWILCRARCRARNDHALGDADSATRAAPVGCDPVGGGVGGDGGLRFWGRCCQGRLAVGPHRALYDTPITIGVSGLDAGHTVTLRMSTRDKTHVVLLGHLSG